jgi:MFS family permease
MRLTEVGPALRNGPLGVRNFRLLTAGQFASTIGDYCYAVALPWFVLSAHGGTIALGTVLACYGVPRAALLPAGGVLADRFGPRTSMLAADATRCALLVLFVVLASRHTVSLVTLAPAAGLLGAGTGVFIPASYAIMPTLLDARRLTAGNGVFTAAQQAGSLLGPAAGGALIAVAGPAPAFGVDAASFAVSALALALIPRAAAAAPAPPAASDRKDASTAPGPAAVPAAAPAAAPPSGRTGPAGHAVPGALSLLRTSRVLQISVLLTLCANLAMGGLIEVAVPDLAHERFGAPGLGALLACVAAGSMAGTLAAARAGSLRRPVPVATAVYMIMAAGMAAVPFLGGLPGAAAAMMVLGAGNGLGNVVLISQLQMWAPPQLLGRLMSMVMLSAYGSYPVSVAVTGVLVHHTGPAAFFPVAAVIAALPLLGGLTQREWRDFGMRPATPPASSQVEQTEKEPGIRRRL